MSPPPPGHQGSGERTTGGIVGSRGRWGMRDWGIRRPPAWHAAGVTDTARLQRERDLVTYYDHEVHERAGRELPADRMARRGAYIARLLVEGRRSVLEVGTGPGRDGTAFVRAGLNY